jgi:hypothetical protein
MEQFCLFCIYMNRIIKIIKLCGGGGVFFHHEVHYECGVSILLCEGATPSTYMHLTVTAVGTFLGTELAVRSRGCLGGLC